MVEGLIKKYCRSFWIQVRGRETGELMKRGILNRMVRECVSRSVYKDLEKLRKKKCKLKRVKK